MSEIYNGNNVSTLLGILLNDTSKCLDSKYPMDKDDFKPVLLHKIIYSVIYNFATSGAKKLDAMQIEEFLSNYPEQKAVYDDNSGTSFIDTVKELSENKVENIQWYWEDLRKHSLLRKYDSLNFPIEEIWDKDKTDGSNERNLNKWSIDNIVDYFDKKQIEVRKEYATTNQAKDYYVGDGIDELLDEYEESPMLGASLISPMLNTLYRGWCKGHLILRGAPSSMGKTTFGISDMCNICSTKVWDDNEAKFVDNPYYQGKGAYIFTEQMIKEIKPRFLATISHIPYNIILDGKFNKDQKEILKEAGRIFKESEMMIIDYPNFTGTGLKEKIKELSLNGYEYIIHDYIWNNFYIMSDLKKITGNAAIRPDEALLHVANILKMSAEEYDVALYTSMQLNGEQDKMDLVNESCLSGSKAVKNKIDAGSVFMLPRKKELSHVEPLIIKWNEKYNDVAFGNKILPNAVSHVFKARYNRYGQNIKVWHHIDNSIGQVVDMFATTWDDKLITDDNGKVIELPKLYIKNKNE